MRARGTGLRAITVYAYSLRTAAPTRGPDTEQPMIKRIEWATAWWSRRGRAVATSAPGGASVLSRQRLRELEQPTYLRRNLGIEGLGEDRRTR